MIFHNSTSDFIIQHSWRSQCFKWRRTNLAKFTSCFKWRGTVKDWKVSKIKLQLLQSMYLLWVSHIPNSDFKTPHYEGSLCDNWWGTLKVWNVYKKSYTQFIVEHNCWLRIASDQPIWWNWKSTDSARLNDKNYFDSNPLDLGRNIPFDFIPVEKDRRGKFGQFKVILVETHFD